MRIDKEISILDEGFRKATLEAIESPENQARKAEAKRRYDCWRDLTKEYVLKAMAEESEDRKSMIPEIKNRVANVSFTRKIVEKKAMVYKSGAQRTFEKEINKIIGDEIYDQLNIDSVMKKTNKFSELFKNCVVQIVPYSDERSGKYKMTLRVLAPFQYDVITDYDNEMEARVFILSSYSESSSQYKARGQSGNREAMVEDSSISNPDVQYIWWSDNYHFTTNSKGEIIAAPEGALNPFGELPFVDFSLDDDCDYWSKAGSDIVDSGILLNILLTDLYYINKFQGMGLFYLIGKGVPKNIKIGPSSAILMEKQEGDPDAQIGFASSNPPISDHIAMIEQYLAFVLSTNGLDVGSVSGSLSSANATSGVQEIIKRADNIEDIEDQQELYKDNEPVLYKKIGTILNYYNERNLLDKPLSEVGTIDLEDLPAVKFLQPVPYQSETEKLDVIERRIDIGLDTLVDAIMRDNPELSVEEAQEKARKMAEERLKKQSLEMVKEVMPDDEEDEDGDNVQNGSKGANGEAE